MKNFIFYKSISNIDLIEKFYHINSRQLRASVIPYSGAKEISQQPDKFQIMMDVSNFTPEEITVKTVDDTISVTAKHEERQDEHGYISREFCRRYKLPKEIDYSTVTSSLSPEGVLTINAPKKQPELKGEERMVPINMTPQSPQPQPQPIPVQNETGGPLP